MKRIMRHSEEYDVYTPWRKYLYWTQMPGMVKKVKRRTHKRERRESVAEIKQQLMDYPED